MFIGSRCCCHGHEEVRPRRDETGPSATFMGELVVEVANNDDGKRFICRMLQTLMHSERPIEWPADPTVGFNYLLPQGVRARVTESTPVVKGHPRCCACCRRKSRHRRRSERFSSTLFAYLSSNVDTLLKLASRYDLRMRLHEDTIRKADIALNELWADDPRKKKKFTLGGRKLAGEELAIPPASHSYEFITVSARHYSSATRHLFHVYGHSKAVLTDADALKIMVRTFQEDGIDLTYEVHKDTSPVVAWFPLDEEKLKEHVRSKWLSWKSTPWNQPIERLRYYFGEKVTMYFAFLAHTSFWLIFPALFGLIVALRRYLDDGVSTIENTWSSVFGLFVALWVTLYLEAWKRVQAVKAQEWGMERFEQEQVTRPQFRKQAKGGRSRVTGEAQAYESQLWQILRRLLSYSVISTLAVMVLIAVFSMFVLRVWLVKKEPDDIREGWGNRLTALINAFQIQIMALLYSAVARALTNMENHQTQTSYDDSLITKTCLFQFVNNYFSLFYIAFLKTNVEILGSKQQCDDDDCLHELEVQLAIILVVRILMGNVNEWLLPMVKRFLRTWWRRCMSREKEVHQGGEEAKTQRSIEDVALLEPYDTFNDYLELLIMFGYASMFGVAFPLAPFIVLVNSFLELRVDSTKLFVNYQRPVPSGAQDIGSWYSFFVLIGYLGVVTNLGIIIFTNTSNFFSLSSTLHKLIAFVSVEHFIFFVKGVIGYSIPDVPTEIAERIERSKYLAKKHVKHKKESVLCDRCRSTPVTTALRHRASIAAANAAAVIGAGAGAGAGTGAGTSTDTGTDTGTGTGGPTSGSEVVLEMRPLHSPRDDKTTDTRPVMETNPLHGETKEE